MFVNFSKSIVAINNICNGISGVINLFAKPYTSHASPPIKMLYRIKKKLKKKIGIDMLFFLVFFKLFENNKKDINNKGNSLKELKTPLGIFSISENPSVFK